MKRYKFQEKGTEYKTLTFDCRDAQNHLVELLDYIKRLGGIGHSFTIIVDPEGNDTRKEFFWDGDGSDVICDIKIDKWVEK